jgi:hypothetical protein
MLTLAKARYGLLFAFDVVEVLEVFALHEFADAFEVEGDALVAKFVDVFYEAVKEVAVVRYNDECSVKVFER